MNPCCKKNEKCSDPPKKVYYSRHAETPTLTKLLASNNPPSANEISENFDALVSTMREDDRHESSLRTTLASVLDENEDKKLSMKELNTLDGCSPAGECTYPPKPSPEELKSQFYPVNFKTTTRNPEEIKFPESAESGGVDYIFEKLDNAYKKFGPAKETAVDLYLTELRIKKHIKYMTDPDKDGYKGSQNYFAFRKDMKSEFTQSTKTSIYTNSLFSRVGVDSKLFFLRRFDLL